METGAKGSSISGPLGHISLLGDISVGLDAECEIDVRRGLAFNSREICSATRWSSSIEARDIIGFLAG